jgi:hypothetical protein
MRMALASGGVTRTQSEFAVDVVLAEHVVGPQFIVSPLIGVLQSRSEGFADGDRTPQFLTLSAARTANATAM